MITAYWIQRLKVNRIASIYGLENAAKRITNKKLKYYRNAESLARLRSPAFATLAGMVQTEQGFDGQIITEDDVVQAVRAAVSTFSIRSCARPKTGDDALNIRRLIQAEYKPVLNNVPENPGNGV